MNRKTGFLLTVTLSVSMSFILIEQQRVYPELSTESNTSKKMTIAETKEQFKRCADDLSRKGIFEPSESEKLFCSVAISGTKAACDNPKLVAANKDNFTALCDDPNLQRYIELSGAAKNKEEH